jgi:hypothetical protein
MELSIFGGADWTNYAPEDTKVEVDACDMTCIASKRYIFRLDLSPALTIDMNKEEVEDLIAVLSNAVVAARSQQTISAFAAWPASW